MRDRYAAQKRRPVENDIAAIRKLGIEIVTAELRAERPRR